MHHRDSRAAENYNLASSPSAARGLQDVLRNKLQGFLE
jgi:hypothetical protein